MCIPSVITYWFKAFTDYNFMPKLKYTNVVFFRYNSTTGMFTVPPGGDGMYFFYIFMTVDPGEYALFEIRINNVRMCSAHGDHDTSGSDLPATSCGVVASLSAGNHMFTI